jgi:hypothetical protein
MRNILFLIIILCSACSTHQSGISFKIVNDTVVVGDDLQIEIINNSKHNYYFPFDLKYRDQSKILMYHPKNKISFMPHTIITDSINKSAKLSFSPCSFVSFLEITPELINNMNYGINGAQKLSYKEIIKIKSGEKYLLKLPLKIKYTSDREYYGESEYILENNKKYFVSFHYNTTKKIVSRELYYSTMDTLRQNGYRLYEGELMSNKIPVIQK